jgi:hypothetical protein
MRRWSGCWDLQCDIGLIESGHQANPSFCLSLNKRTRGESDDFQSFQRLTVNCVFETSRNEEYEGVRTETTEGRRPGAMRSFREMGVLRNNSTSTKP